MNDGKKLHCNTFHEGCGNDVPIENYNKEAMLCVSCATNLAHNYGFTYEYAGHALLQINIPWYERQMPGFEKLTYRDQVRMLAHAAGSLGVRNLTDRERKGSEKIRAKFPNLFTLIKPDKFTENVVKEIEQMTEEW